MSDPFYRAFEEKFRGPRALIRSRLGVYLPYVRPLLSQQPGARALDLGCGRGEWLQLLLEQGFAVQGVDLDPAMLEPCSALGLDVHVADALAHLTAQPDASLAIVSSFHLAEHLPFAAVRELVAQALRVLQPGGLLILETPNPENLIVGACNFYLDPTHQRPIPPNLLAFLPEYSGFARTSVLRLQHDPGLLQKPHLNLAQVLFGVSPDYAVVAQKEASSATMLLFDTAFAQRHGLELAELAERYQEQANIRFSTAEARSQQAESKAEQAESKAEQAEAKAQQAESKAEQAESKAQQAESKAQQAEAASTEASMQLQAVYASTSWRITAPLRTLKHVTSRVLAKKNLTLASSPLVGFSFTRDYVKPLLAWGVSYANRSPRFKRLALRVLNRMPGLAVRLRQVHFASQLGANWTESAIQARGSISAHGVRSTSIGQLQQIMTHGINARQRSPLEAHFHSYVGRE